MSKPSPKNAALAMIGSSQLTLEKQALKKFQARTIDAIELIARTESDNVQRRALAGVALLIVKERLKWGEFMPWLKKHVTSSGYTQCTYFMRIGQLLLRDAKLEGSDLLALTHNVNTQHLAKKLQGTNLSEAVRKFVGDLSWTELLETHGIREGGKKLGGARTAGAEGEPEAIDPELLAQLKREELSAWLENGRQLLVKENACQHLKPEDVRAVDASAAALLAEWRKGVAQILKAS